MRIANPIYDVVFKFMLEDEEVAKSFISAIIEEEVLEVHFAAQERILRQPLNDVAREDKEKLFLTVCRFDFSAKISIPNGGHKTVIIELQKAKFSADIMRFRRYLGVHYQSSDNIDNHKKARQIYSIFLLGYDIGIHDCPIIQVDQNIKDGTTKKSLEVTNEFIDSLHHRSWIVQLDQLKQHRRSNAEKLLSIFGLDDHIANRHILQVNENDFPERYIPVIRRLRMASESADVQTEMEMEDDFMQEFQDKERSLAEKDKALEEKDKTIEEKDKTIEEDKKEIKAKDKTIEEDKKALKEKDKTIKAKDRTIEEDKKALKAKDRTIDEKDRLIKELQEQLAKSQM